MGKAYTIKLKQANLHQQSLILIFMKKQVFYLGNASLVWPTDAVAQIGCQKPMIEFQHKAGKTFAWFNPFLIRAYCLLMMFAMPFVMSRAQWTQHISGQGSLINKVSVAPDNNNVIWVEDQEGTSVSISTDGGETWVVRPFPENVYTNGLGTLAAVSATTAYTVVANMKDGSQSGVYKTIDGGLSWNRLTGAFSASSFPDIVYFWNKSEGVAIGDGDPSTNLEFEIYTTADEGNTWTQVQSIPPGDYDWSLNGGDILKVVNGTIYFGTGSGRIFKSADKGITWTAINTPSTNIQNMSFDFANQNDGMMIISESRSEDNYHVYTTSDGGQNWIEKVWGASYEYLQYVKYVPGTTNTYVSSNYQYGLSYTTDNGATWTRHPSFMNLGLGTMEFLSDGRLFVGGWGNVFVSGDDYFSVINPIITSVVSEATNEISIYFSEPMENVSATNLNNYEVHYYEFGTDYSLGRISATIDPVNPNKVILTLADDLPENKEIWVYTYNLQSADGRQILFPSDGSVATLSTWAPGFTGGTTGNLTWVMNSNNGTLTISGTGAMPDYDYSGHAPWYNYCSAINTVIVSEGVTSIGEYAFYDCGSLSSVTLPNSVTSIGNFAFEFCHSLTSVNIPTDVSNIGDYAFLNSGLTTITIPNSVTSIGSGAFYKCMSLAAIEVDNGNTAYSSEEGILYDKNKTTFIQCPAGKSGAVIIPASVTSVDESCFDGGSSITAINVDNNNTAYSSQDGILYNKDRSQLICCPEGYPTNSISIPNNVTTIGDYAFESCSNIASVTIPEGITNVGSYSFVNCTSLTKIVSKNPTSPAVGENVFYYVNKSTCVLEVPIGSKDDYQAVDQWKDFLIINESDFTDAVPEHAVNKLKIYSECNVLVIEGGSTGEKVQVYNPSGVLIYSEALKVDKTSIPIPGKGVYMVCTNGETVTVLVE